jgi:hypothetical protein
LNRGGFENMPRIHFDITTDKVGSEGRKWGKWSLTAVGGLDENPAHVLQEASRRLEQAIDSLPEGERYPRFPEGPSSE